MKKPVKKIALIHDICSYGQAAMTNMLPILSVKGLEPCPIPTMILSTHTGGYGIPAINKLGDFIDRLKEHYIKNNINFDVSIIGYIGDIDNIKYIEAFLEASLVHGHIILDPICGDNGKLYSNFDMDYVYALKSLLSKADIITPNITEAMLLTDRCESINTMSNDLILDMCRDLASYGPKHVIITSVEVDNETIGTAIYSKDDDNMEIVCQEKEKENFHGTGDVFAALFTAFLEDGESIYNSVCKAGDIVSGAIQESSKYNYDKREGLIMNSVITKLI